MSPAEHCLEYKGIDLCFFFADDKPCVTITDNSFIGQRELTTMNGHGGTGYGLSRAFNA